MDPRVLGRHRDGRKKRAEKKEKEKERVVEREEEQEQEEEFIETGVGEF